jgi:glycosyltransferase involved in cell wall biosynthesis
MTARVSVLIPVFNARPWVGRAIESALRQTRPPDEIIVLDDGSTDGSLEIVEQYRHDVRVDSWSNAGQNGSRNRLTSLSTGEWLVYLDADDELAPDAIDAKWRLCDHVDAVYGSMETAIFEGATQVRSTFRTALDYQDPWVAAFQWAYPNTSAFMFRRSAVVQAGAWTESAVVCTDYDLYFRLLLSGARFKAAPDARSMYRHWSRAQAVHTSAVARASARIRMMRRAADDLVRSGAMTAERRGAFEQSTLECVRSLYHFDRRLARAALCELRGWNPGAAPAPPAFPSTYALVFRLAGLDVAEALAALRRNVRLAVTPSRDEAPNYDAP